MTRALYLRPDAVDRLTAAAGVPQLNKKQQAGLLGVSYHSYWRLVGGGRIAGTKAVADVLVGVEAFCARHRCKKPSFDELFEIREIEDEPTAAIAA